MKSIPINEAESIVEPFWDGGSSEHPDDKISCLDQYTVSVPDGVIGSIDQTWCALRVRFDRGEPGSVISMSRECELYLAGYDTFRIFASIPSHVQLTVRGSIDGDSVTIIDQIFGRDTNDEFDGPMSGNRLTYLEVEYRFTDSRPVSMQVLWFGLANIGRQKEMEKKVSPYTSEWADFIEKSSESDADRAYSPSLGILIGAAELKELRDSLHSGPLSASYKRFLNQAKTYLDWEPEKDIGKYVPKPDRRWVRNRDMDRASTAGIMEIVAFAGMIEQDYEMTRMACRMALSASHCEYWSESIVGTLPGTTWHHRSFTEEVYSRACGLVLDWAGFALTPPAKQLIRDAIIMKGLPRIESDFKRMEYIRHMNQGIVFSSGRIFGTLALLDTHPRYASVVLEAERDLQEMIDSYVHDDGGTLEGMGYWAYTFSSAMPVILALARYHGKSMADYGSETLRKTGDYGLGMLSTVGNGSRYLPVNDAHADMSYPPVLLAAYTALSTDQRWRVLYEQALADDEGIPDIYHLIMAPRDAASPMPGEMGVNPYAAFADVGQVSSVRNLAGKDRSLVHLCSGPTYGGHYHEDKGSIIIEAGGEALVCDRGVTDYHHPETSLMKMASRHNLVYPEPADGRIEEQPHDAYGGKLTSSSWGQDVFLACSDNTGAWRDGLFTRNFRRVCSPWPDLVVVDDELVLSNPTKVWFYINTAHSVRADKSSGTISGTRYSLKVIPLNWGEGNIETAVDGVDSRLNETNIIRIYSPTGLSHRLITLFTIVPAEGVDQWTIEKGASPAVRGPAGIVSVSRIEEQFLEISIAREDGRKATCSCSGGEWNR